MAQGKVTEFFSSRKRNASLQPSKRRKVQRLETADVVEAPVVSTEQKSVRITRRAQKTVNVDIKTVAPVKTTRRTKESNKSRTTANKKAVESPGKGISSYFDVSSKDTVETDETTAVKDDHHASPISTPTKSAPKRALQKSQVQDVREEINITTPESEKAYDFAKFAKPKVSPDVATRRKLHMPREPLPKGDSKFMAANAPEATLQINSNTRSKAANPKTKGPVLKEIDASKLNPAEMRKKLQKCGKLSELKQQLAKLDKGVARIKEAQEAVLREQPPEEETFQLKVDAKVKPDLKVKTSKKVAAEVKAPQEKSAAKPDSPTVTKVPAYQRFHNLAQPVPPSLSLPYKYKLLGEMFHSVEMIVSMLHKRAEVCTFAKLKSAVQQIMRKSFEERNLGQIKTVYPSAYILRQEKGLPDFQKTQSANAYQLTIEADLHQDLQGYKSEKQVKPEYDPQGRPIISASRLLQRKALFHRLLVDIVKQHHQKFLESLSTPVTVPEEKLTRWHPRFKVDEVPDIPVADVPQPPDVKRFQTAAEALQHATTTMNPRVKNALEIVAAKNAKNSENKTPSIDHAGTANAPPAAAKATSSGVPQSLLERIRAKEAAKQELSMMRSPAQDERLQRVERLPEIVRIIRTMFVTQKKPAITWEDTIIKISDSYRSCLGEVEAERHIKLLLELCPEWISTIQITRGRFLKIDKNKDTTAIVNKLVKMGKQ